MWLFKKPLKKYLMCKDSFITTHQIKSNFIV